MWWLLFFVVVFVVAVVVAVDVEVVIFLVLVVLVVVRNSQHKQPMNDNDTNNKWNRRDKHSKTVISDNDNK